MLQAQPITMVKSKFCSLNCSAAPYILHNCGLTLQATPVGVYKPSGKFRVVPRVPWNPSFMKVFIILYYDKLTIVLMEPPTQNYYPVRMRKGVK